MSRRPEPVNLWVLALLAIALLGSSLILYRAVEAEAQLPSQPRGASR